MSLIKRLVKLRIAELGAVENGRRTEYYGNGQRKIAVLMTDGEYNEWYSSGQGDSIAQAKSLCTKMKAKEIEIFTVGFKLDTQESIDTLNFWQKSNNICQ